MRGAGGIVFIMYITCYKKSTGIFVHSITTGYYYSSPEARWIRPMGRKYYAVRPDKSGQKYPLAAPRGTGLQVNPGRCIDWGFHVQSSLLEDIEIT